MEIIQSPVYLDTNIFIYSMEGYDEYYDLLIDLFNHIETHDLDVITSQLTLAECLVKPEKDKNKAVIEQYKAHINTSHRLTVKAVSRKILIDSARERSELGLKLPDAIHMATALDQGCKTFITNDKKLKSPESIKRMTLEDLVEFFA